MPKRLTYTLLTSVWCLAACGTARSYSMPLASSEAPQAVDPLLVCATRQNLQAKRDGDAVVVRLDSGTSLVYKPAKGSLVMEAHVQTSERDPATAEKLAAAKAAGESLFKCAQAVPTPTSSAAGAPTPTLGNTTTSKPR